MFVRTEFVFSEPICPCEKENWVWSITLNGDNPGLFFRCKSCGTRLQVSLETFAKRCMGIFQKPWPSQEAGRRTKSASQILEEGPLRNIEVDDAKK